MMDVDHGRPVWGPDASLRPVRVRFRHANPQLIIGANRTYQEQVSTRVMSHKDYFERMIPAIQVGEVLLVGVEQVREDA